MQTEKFLRREEFDLLLATAKDDRERCVLYLLAGVGLRVYEMCAARVEDINFDRSYLHIPESSAKGGKARTVVLIPEVVEALQAHLAGRDQGWILPSYAGDHLTPRRVQYILDSIAKKAGIDRRIHPHLLRHSHAVWALDSGISVYDLQKQLGHSSILTTAIYLESAPGHRRDSYIKSGLLSH